MLAVAAAGQISGIESVCTSFRHRPDGPGNSAICGQWNDIDLIPSSSLSCGAVSQGSWQGTCRSQQRSCLGWTTGGWTSRKGGNTCLFADFCSRGQVQIPTRRARVGRIGMSRQLPELAVAAVVMSRLLEPVIFDASKLSIDFMDSKSPDDVAYPGQLMPRHYTLTHHDVTAELRLSIGSSLNSKQLSGWYTRLLRDEVTAEWRSHGSEKDQLSLHVHCHVSGGHPFLAPAGLRDWIFQREMPLVLQALRHGDEALLTLHPELDQATVWVHYHSSDPQYDRADCWGPLCWAAANLGSAIGAFAQAEVVLPQLATQAWRREEDKGVLDMKEPSSLFELRNSGPENRMERSATQNA